MTTIHRKISVDAETLELEHEFMGAMAKIRERLARELEEGLLATLEDVLNSPASLKTPAKFKFTQVDGEMFFTLLAFEAKIDV